MTKKRTVFLLGSGAALGWEGAPSTQNLTDFITTNGPKNDQGQYITKYIYDHFKKKSKWKRCTQLRGSY